MPTKKRPRKLPVPSSESLRPVLVLLEEIRSQNQITIDAVEARARELKNDLAQFREQSNARIEVLEAAVRQNSIDIRHLQADVKQLQSDVRDLAGKVEKVTRVEERVAALERSRG